VTTAQPKVYQVTRILFVCKKNKKKQQQFCFVRHHVGSLLAENLSFNQFLNCILPETVFPSWIILCVFKFSFYVLGCCKKLMPGKNSQVWMR